MNRASAFVALLAAVLWAAGCSSRVPELPPSMIPLPVADEVESVLFLFGDAGYADETRDPVLRRLAADVELWSGRLARDSSVMVLFLGDIVYPLGLRHSVDEYPRDSAIVQSQVNILGGANARSNGAIGYFLAGNHDWGNARNEAGVRRLLNLEEFLDRQRASGVHVRLQPEAGQPGPAVIDLGRHTRLLLFDTAWWLLAESEYLKQRAFQQAADVIRSAPDRAIIVAAHHPFASAGPHGGTVPFWKTLGLRTFMHRAGAVMQDLNSIVYRELRDALLRAFHEGQPLVFAGGHDHNLQVIASDSFPRPRFDVISGSGSKVSSVGHVDGMLYRHEAPGYVKLLTHRSGRVDLFVVAAPDRSFLRCTGEGEALAQCMEESVAAIQPTFAMRIR
jgi:hypothetical protein